MKAQLQFGLNSAIPEGVAVAWGARWIFPDEQLGDRQSFEGIETPEGKKLQKWLNGGAIKKAMKASRATFSSTDDVDVILYQDTTGIIAGNPRRSFGYVYVAGYLKGSAK